MEKVWLLNDEILLNDRYRSGLRDEFSANGYKVISRKSNLGFLVTLNFTNGLIVVSNLKSTVKALFLSARRLNIILNGLGRYRSLKMLRLLAFIWSYIRVKDKIAVQNYTDYRYLRRVLSQRVIHVQGSGGTKREIYGDGNFTVSRDDKIEIQLDSLLSLHSILGDRITLVGVNTISKSSDLTLMGYVQQDKIIQGRTFILCDGYGEGFPHVLADAICSGCEIICSETAYRTYGLYTYGLSIEKITEGWIKFKANDICRSSVKNDVVSKQYLNFFI